jgi:hypothetical protein
MYVPAEHSAQNIEPASDAPVVQFLHLDCFGLSENQLAGQFLHSDALSFPVWLEYVPGGQLLHRSTSTTPVAEEYVAFGHFLQEEFDVCSD